MALLSALLSVAAAGAAHAQLGDPGEQTVDTDVTPVAKDPERWQWTAGAKFSPDGPKPADVPEQSVTPFELDLFTVAFSSMRSGFAAGAECSEPVPEGASPDEARAHVRDCKRVPVIYRYSVNELEEASWEEAYRGDGPGFVGAIDWLSDDRAVAVGGSGEYPRRERRPSTPQNDPARDGRAWLYEGGSWRELTDLPDGMRGMTAFDASPRPADCGPGVSECGVAGAFRQLWMFEDGSFTKGIDDQSAESELDRAFLFQFRVRDVRFADLGGNLASFDPADAIRAIAVTSGCCAENELHNGPRLLVLHRGRWYVRQREEDLSNASDLFHRQSRSESPRPAGAAWEGISEEYGTRVDRIEDGCPPGTGFGSDTLCGERIFEEGLAPLGFPVLPPLEPVLGPWPIEDETLPRPEHPAPAESDELDDTVAGAHDQHYLERHRELDRETSRHGSNAASPDSLYAVGRFRPGDWGWTAWLAASPGGPIPAELASVSESASQLAEATVTSSRDGPSPGPSTLLVASNTDKLASTLRLHDLDNTPVPMTNEPPGPRSLASVEAVGVLRRTGQGASYGPQDRFPDRSPAGLDGCKRANDDGDGQSDPAPGVPPEDCDPNVQRFVGAYQSRNVYKLPAYALNAIEVVDEETGAGWAVGDHGAILSLEGETAAQQQAQEPEPPTLRGRRTEELADADAYRVHHPRPTDQPGSIPPVSLRPQVTLPDPTLASTGAVGSEAPPTTIAISRDGAEGWAFGLRSNPSGLQAYHLQGDEWRACGSELGEAVADRACASLARYRELEVRDVERVPLERDDDPTNDDEFEAAALTNEGLLRYRDGRWSYDQAAEVAGRPVSGKDIAFTAPDDGWTVPTFRTLEGINHFDGERWVRCTASETSCGDPEGRLDIPIEDIVAGQLTISETSRRGLRLATAGDRVYAFATRQAATGGFASGAGSASYPMIIYRERGGTWTGGIDETDDGVYNPIDGGWDPGYYLTGEDNPGPVDPGSAHPLLRSLLGYGEGKAEKAAGGDEQLEEGRIFTVSLAEGAEGIEGWAVGLFGGLDSSAQAAMMRLEDGRWRYWSTGDAADEHLRELSPQTAPDPRAHVTLPPAAGPRTSFLFRGGEVPALAFNPGRERWEALDTPWLAADLPGLDQAGTTRIDVAAPDGGAGFWVGLRQGSACTTCGGQVAFSHYTDRVRKPVLSEVPNPAQGTAITTMAAAADGSVWLGDEHGALHRYDRLTGWEREVRVPGWDPRQATRRTPVNAVALGPHGEGVAVGAGGRIAEIAPDYVRLDDAAGTACDLAAPVPPCGTGRDLHSASVAADGSALVAGEAQTLLWRPANGEFRRIEPPRLPRTSEIEAIELPRGDRAFLLTERDQLLRGELAGGSWSWRFELGTIRGGDPLAHGQAINDLAFDPSGRGFAVGDRGLLLERNAGESAEWRLIPSGRRERFQSVSISGEDGVLIGAEAGLFLTLAGEQVTTVRAADPYDQITSAFNGYGQIRGTALAPGLKAGQVEAWAVLQAPAGSGNRSPRPQALLHYASDPDEPLYDPSRGVEPLPDSPASQVGELTFAAFGKQECQTIRGTAGNFGQQLNAVAPCEAANGSKLTHELIAEAVVRELTSLGEQAGPRFSLFTGDVSDGPGGDKGLLEVPRQPTGTLKARSPVDANAKHRRWIELVADQLADAGLPVVGAIGGQDLALHPEVGYPPHTDLYFGGSLSARQPAEGAGVRGGPLNLPWRAAMASMPAPWLREDEGSDEGERSDGVGFEPAEAGALSVELPDAETPSESLAAPTSSTMPPRVRLNSLSTAGAPTHYAMEIVRDGEEIARLVVVDSSLGSISASNPGQHPAEAGGQERWLEEMLCFDGSPADLEGDARECTRTEGQAAIVLTNTPTYTYGPISPAETMADAARFEEILLRNKATVVVSGRLGWNGLYWATAPGVHEPCPGQPYQSQPPRPGTRICGHESRPEGEGELPDATQLASDAQKAAGGAPLGSLPFVVSSAAGGRFNEGAIRAGQATPENGFWQGYSIVRLAPDGDPRKTIVEQRPILDWVGLAGDERTVLARRKVRLDSFAREAFGLDTPPRYYSLDTEAITHRYHLLLADPDEPWRACFEDDQGCRALAARLSVEPGEPVAQPAAGEELSDECSPYLCLPARVGEIDPQSGTVSAKSGRYPRTFAIATISAARHIATYPLVFEPSPSFVVTPFEGPPAIPANAQPSVGRPPNLPQPEIPTLSLPEPPVLPQIPPLAAQTPPEPQPPAPPAPPPPAEQPSPLNLSVAPTGLTVATPTAVIQPPTPPVNPAPPGGARREARQRQAAAQKSGADAEEGAGEEQATSWDSAADGPPASEGSRMTRHESAASRHGMSVGARYRDRAGSFTPLARPDQPSAWARGALYGSGLTLFAFALAAGWTRGRPTLRQRAPDIPAGALAETRSRR